MAGGGGTTNSTVTQSNLPKYAQPYYEALMDRGLTESQQPYTPYNGQRLAGESDATQTGLNQMSQYAQSGPGLYTGAAQLNGQVGQAAMGMAGNQITAQNIGTSTFDQNAANQYMSPYENNVIASSQRDAVRNAQIEQQQRNLSSAQSGSFGGSRAAVQNQLSANSLQNNLSDIYSTGMQNAYENAQTQFNTDQGRSLSAAQSNQSANLDAQKSTQQYGLQALGLAGDSANQAAGMQTQMDNSAMQKAQAQLGVGQTQEDYQQQQLDQSYQDFVNQRDSEKQNLQFLSSLLQGVPVSANSDVTQSTGGGNNIAGALGSAGGLQALMTLGKTQ